MKYYIFGLLAISMISVSCQKQSVPAPDFSKGLIELGKQNLSNGNTVNLYAADTLRTGYNKLFVRITNNNLIVNTAAVSIHTLMDMGMMKHSSPSVEPVYNSQHQMYDAGAVFTMASESGGWSLKVKVEGEELTFVLNVKESKTKLVSTATATNGDVYVFSLFPVKNYKVGLNDFSLVIFKKENAMAFSPARGLDAEFSPEMTSMGHSSPNNVNPVDSGNGFYNGKVNFTMSGDWRFHFKITSGDVVLFDDVYLDIVF